MMKNLKTFFLSVIFLALMPPLSGYSQTTKVQPAESPASPAATWSQEFEKIAEFNIQVPADFTQDMFFDTLCFLAGAENLSEFFARHYSLSPEGKLLVNVQSSQPFLPGEKKTACIYLLREKMSSQECLRFVEEHGGQLPNIQGIFLIQDKLWELVPRNCWVIGLDDPQYLVKDHQSVTRVFRLALDKRNSWVGDFGYFNASWGNRRNSGWRFCLLFFKDAE